MFFPWAKVILCKPRRVEVNCSVERPQKWQMLGPETVDELDGIARKIVDCDEDPSIAPMMLAMPLEVGRRSLMEGVGDPIASDFQAEARVTRRNAALIEAKSRLLIDMGIYRIAGSDVVDRAQLVVIRSKPEEPDNPKYARTAHGFHSKNDKAVLLPVPMATREEIYAFLPQFKVFWKTDADRGFQQIVQATDAVRHTGFGMFGEL